MIVHCERCCVLIEHDNRRHPGYCSATCRTTDRQHRTAERREQQFARRVRTVRRQLLAAGHSFDEADRLAALHLTSRPTGR